MTLEAPTMLLEGLGAAAVAGFAYSVLVEPYRLGMTRLEFTFDRLPREFDGFTILHLTDLHMKKQSWLQNLCNSRLERKILAYVAGRPVDLIAITGDAELRGERGFQAMRDMLSVIPSTYGAYFVPGNGEYQDYDVERALTALDSWGVKTLRNASCVIEKDGARISLLGVDDPFTRHNDLRAAAQGVPSEDFKILLAHSPSVGREALKEKVDLMLSGHTHGGQVRLPFVGALYTHLGKGSPKLDMGVYEGARLSARTGLDAGDSKVFVSRGVGLSEFYIRFMCPPEIATITLRRRS
jgi:uncharacterized protein